jgi:anti-sigma factor RsiW
MSGAECDSWRGMQAMHLIGRLDPHEEDQLAAHLAACSSCRAEAEDLAGVESALKLADIDHLDSAAELAIPIESARWEQLRVQRQRRVGRVTRTWAAAGIAAAAVVAVALGAVALHHPASPNRTVALTGTSGVHASVVLTAKAWGTQATFDEAGQRAGQVLTVSMETTPGTWWVAGSYRTSGSSGRLQVTLSCAVPATQITHIWVSDDAGHTVLRGYAQ